MIRIITDSAASLPFDVAKAHNIEVIPMFINWQGKEYVASEMDVDEFYSDIYHMIDDIPTSSQPSVGELEAFFRPIAQAGDEVLGVFISTRMSGTVENVYAALNRLKEDYPNFQYRVIDSTSNSYDEAFAVLEAAHARDEGVLLDECANRAVAVVKRCKWLFTPESLRFLKAGGRIGTAHALLGGLMKVTPVLTVRDGETATQAKVRTQKKALNSIVEHFATDIKTYGLKHIVVHYIGFADPAIMWAKEYIEPLCPSLEVPVLPVSPVVGLHVGPAIGIVYECEKPIPTKVSGSYPSLILQ